MADLKISQLNSIVTVVPATDVLPVVQGGTTLKITPNQILGAGGTATLASATITGDLTARNWFVTGGSLPGVGNNNPFAYRIGGGGLGIGAATETGTTAPIVFYCGAGGVEQYRIAPLGVNTWSDGAGGTRMTLNSTGLGVGVVPSAGRGAVQLSAGVGFPATQSASSDANCLDDYEEGTFTPTVTASAGTLTTTTVNEAVYTKIGRLVSVAVDISIVDIGTASGQLFFSLPFNQTVQSNVGALRELGATGQMGQIIYQSSTQVSAALYNNGTLIVNGYRIRGTYTYTV